LTRYSGLFNTLTDDSAVAQRVNPLSFVMPGFMPGIHVFLHRASVKQDVDGRNKSGHDE
jgi:hypothetical protein